MSGERKIYIDMSGEIQAYPGILINFAANAKFQGNPVLPSLAILYSKWQGSVMRDGVAQNRARKNGEWRACSCQQGPRPPHVPIPLPSRNSSVTAFHGRTSCRDLRKSPKGNLRQNLRQHLRLLRLGLPKKSLCA